MTEIVIDPATGLPELPEGHFWRVSEGEYDLWLEIRKNRKRFGSRSVINSRVYADWDAFEAGEIEHPVRISRVSDTMFTPEAILGTAKHLLRKWHGRDAKIMRYAENKKLLGDYPPKKLEVK